MSTPRKRLWILLTACFSLLGCIEEETKLVVVSTRTEIIYENKNGSFELLTASLGRSINELTQHFDIHTYVTNGEPSYFFQSSDGALYPLNVENGVLVEITPPAFDNPEVEAIDFEMVKKTLNAASQEAIAEKQKASDDTRQKVQDQSHASPNSDNPR